MAPKNKSAAKIQGDLELGTLIRNTVFIDLSKGASPGPEGDVRVVPETSPGIFSKSPQVVVYGRRRKPLSRLPSNEPCDIITVDCPVTYLRPEDDLPSTPDIRYADNILIPMLTVFDLATREVAGQAFKVAVFVFARTLRQRV